MAKCKRCGKKGLFLSVNREGLCPNCAIEKHEARDFLEKIKEDHNEFQKQIEKENEILAIYNDANERYKQDKDLDALIDAYERAFVKSDVIKAHNGHIKLAELYMRKKEYDKAWGYLNSLILKNPANHFLAEIRMTQGKLLKKEKRYVASIEHYMLGYLDDIYDNFQFKKDKFERDIKTMVEKLGWTENTIREIEDIILSSARKANKENLAIKRYKEIVEIQK